MAPSNVPTLSGCPTVSPALLAIFKGCRRPKAAGLSTNSSVEIVQASRFFLGKSTFLGKVSARGGAGLINSSGEICLLTPAPLSTGFVELCTVADWGRASRGQPLARPWRTLTSGQDRAGQGRPLTVRQGPSIDSTGLDTGKISSYLD